MPKLWLMEDIIFVDDEYKQRIRDALLMQCLVSWFHNVELKCLSCRQGLFVEYQITR